MSRNVVLTGATGGIGAQTARILAKRGDRLLLTSRSAHKLDALASELAGAGADVRVVPANLASVEDRAEIVASAQQLPGGVDVLINNAGASWFGAFDEQAHSSIEDLVSTNLVAPLLLIRDVLPVLKRDGGVVANVGSVVGSIALPGQAVYAATKAGLHAFSEALRRELGESGVRIVYVAPRATDTRMNGAFQRDVNMAMHVATDDPATVAERLVAAIDRGTRERFIGWPERLFVKLNALAPGLVDLAMRKQARLVRQGTPSMPLGLSTHGENQ